MTDKAKRRHCVPLEISLICQEGLLFSHIIVIKSRILSQQSPVELPVQHPFTPCILVQQMTAVHFSTSSAFSFQVESLNIDSPSRRSFFHKNNNGRLMVKFHGNSVAFSKLNSELTTRAHNSHRRAASSPRTTT